MKNPQTKWQFREVLRALEVCAEYGLVGPGGFVKERVEDLLVRAQGLGVDSTWMNGAASRADLIPGGANVAGPVAARPGLPVEGVRA